MPMTRRGHIEAADEQLEQARRSLQDSSDYDRAAARAALASAHAAIAQAIPAWSGDADEVIGAIALRLGRALARAEQAEMQLTKAVDGKAAAEERVQRRDEDLFASERDMLNIRKVARAAWEESTRMQGVLTKLTAGYAAVADQAIGLFLTLRDEHGSTEEEARAGAVAEVAAGADAVDELSRHEQWLTAHRDRIMRDRDEPPPAPAGQPPLVAARRADPDEIPGLLRARLVEDASRVAHGLGDDFGGGALDALADLADVTQALADTVGGDDQLDERRRAKQAARGGFTWGTVWTAAGQDTPGPER